MTKLLQKIKSVMMATPMPTEETPVGVGAVTETNQWEYVLFGSIDKG